MKTIKVIDLLNKIRNEDAPKKIIYNSRTYEYEDYDYFNKNVGYLFDKYNVSGILNDTVEIIEDTPKENKRIEKMKKLSFDEMITKINEIIDKVNGE